MNPELTTLYHWAPSSARKSILTKGLKIFQPMRGVMRKNEWPDEFGLMPDDYRMGHVCLGTSPRRAWFLSGGMDTLSEAEDWDLYEVTLAEGDDCTVRMDNSPSIIEVRVSNPIPPNRVWFSGTRSTSLSL